MHLSRMSSCNLPFTDCDTCICCIHTPPLCPIGLADKSIMSLILSAGSTLSDLKPLTDRYLHNRIKCAVTVCQLSTGIQFVMICLQQCW